MHYFILASITRLHLTATKRDSKIKTPRTTPRTTTYGLDNFGYRAAQIWNFIPLHIQNTYLSIIKQLFTLCSSNYAQPVYEHRVYFTDRSVKYTLVM